MHSTSLRKVGGSIMLAVPPAILDLLQLRPGARVGLSVEGGRLVVEPQTRQKYSLDELLAQCDPSAVIPPDDQEWLAGPAIGGELL